MRRIPLSMAIVIEICLIVMLFSGELSAWGVIVVIINGVLIIAQGGEAIGNSIGKVFEAYLRSSLHRLIHAKRIEEEKRKYEIEIGTEAGKKLVNVQNLKAPLYIRVSSLMWLATNLLIPITPQAKTNLLDAISHYDDEFGRPMDDAALMRFIIFYGNDFIKNNNLDVDDERELQLLLLSKFSPELQAILWKKNWKTFPY